MRFSKIVICKYVPVLPRSAVLVKPLVFPGNPCGLTSSNPTINNYCTSAAEFSDMELGDETKEET